MAVPTITAISPVSGHTGGRQFIEIEGTNFRTPTAPVLNTSTGITAPSPPSVAVTFGTTPAREVRWVSPTLLFVVSPIHDPGAADVTVTNIDDSGNPIPSETVTQASGYTFLLPILTGDNPSDLERLARAFQQELARQVTPNVTYPRSTDYSDPTHAALSFATLPKLPGVVIADLTLRENDFYSRRGGEHVQQEDGSFIELQPPVTVDLVFLLAGISNSKVELLNLSAALKAFFRKNPYLSMDRDPADASKGTVSYEMDSFEDKETKFVITSNSDNVAHFVLGAVVRGFDIEGMSGLPMGTSIADQGEGVRDYGQPAETIELDPTGALPPPSSP